MNKNFYIGFVEAIDRKEGFIQVFYAWGNHMGEAIDAILNYAIKLNLKSPKLMSVDAFQFESLPKKTIKSEEFDSYYLKSRSYFPSRDISNFQLPYGVVFSSEEGEFEPELISEGYARYIEDNEIEHLEIVVDRTRLLDIYLKIVEKLKLIRVLWVRVDHDWESNVSTEFYSNEALNNFIVIKEFISENMSDVFLNGYLSITVYSDEGATNISIDDHKKIHISSQSGEFIDSISKYVEDSGFKYYDDKLYSIDCGYYHWHYRPTDSKNRKDLITHLKNKGFILWRTE